MLLDQIGLFPGQEQALQVLAQHETGMTMGDLSRALHVRPPTASKTVARLAAQGLVERESSTPDGRVVLVKLTEAGRERLKAVQDAVEELEKELADLFDGKEAKRLRKSLRRITRKLGDMVDPDGNAYMLPDEDSESDEDE